MLEEKEEEENKSDENNWRQSIITGMRRCPLLALAKLYTGNIKMGRLGEIYLSSFVIT